MRERYRWLCVIALSLFVAVAGAQRREQCSRRCLLEILTDYTEALTDNDISRLVVAKDLRVTSNGEVATLGDGQVWGDGRRLSYRQTFVDPLTGAAVFYGVVTNVVNSGRPGAQADAAEAERIGLAPGHGELAGIHDHRPPPSDSLSPSAIF